MLDNTKADGLTVAKPSRKWSKDDTSKLFVAAEVAVSAAGVAVTASAVCKGCWSQSFFECFGFTNWMFSTVQKVVCKVE